MASAGSLSLRMFRESRSFQGTILVFAVANLWSWLRHRLFPVCCDQEITVGFPVPFHISGSIAGQDTFYLLGFLLDIAIVLTLAVVVMWIAHVAQRVLRDG